MIEPDIKVPMQCTATTRKVNLHADQSTRCSRPLGHAGLHRIIQNGCVCEFPDADCWFPHFSIGN